MLVGLLVIGFFLGMRHALEADHVAAVASLASNSRSLRDTIQLGSAWGVGHTLTLFLFGALALSLKTMIPAQLTHALESAVGLMLMVLGVDVVRRIVRTRAYPHIHRSKSTCFLHMHSRAVPVHNHRTLMFPGRALLVGMVHGMAGSAALIVLALQTVESAASGLLYMAVFGLGSIIGMALCAAAITLPLRWAATHHRSFHWALQVALGAATFALGASIVWEQGSAWSLG